VRLLLDHVDRRQVYQALLAAINLGNEDIAETIIEHPKYDETSGELSKQRGGLQQFNDDSQFSEEITPLILASQQNRFEVRQMSMYTVSSAVVKMAAHCSVASCPNNAEVYNSSMMTASSPKRSHLSSSPRSRTASRYDRCPCTP